MAELSPRLAALAGQHGLTSCWVHPVTVPGEDLAAAALVMFRHRDGMPTRLTWAAVHRTARLLRFVLQWDRSHRALAFAATHDTLTGLANALRRRRLNDIAKLAGSRPPSVLDLDHSSPSRRVGTSP